MTESTIEWTQHTWNVILGCSKISEGCQKCYALQQSYRNNAIAQSLDPEKRGRLSYYEGLTEKRGGRTEWTGKVAFVAEALGIPLKRKKPTTWFVNSMSDLFHESVTDEQLDQIFAVMALTPQHTYQILTKRPERMRDYIDSRSLRFPEMQGIASNIWLGVSVENQAVAHRVDILRNTIAAVRFLSCEPLLESLDLELTGIHWAIAGYESGRGARLPIGGENAVRNLRDQCVAANVPFFYKQRAENGKKISLPELDGQVWNQMPLSKR